MVFSFALYFFIFPRSPRNPDLPLFSQTHTLFVLVQTSCLFGCPSLITWENTDSEFAAGLRLPLRLHIEHVTQKFNRRI
jgi:hypothetical protein